MHPSLKQFDHLHGLSATKARSSMSDQSASMTGYSPILRPTVISLEPYIRM